MPEKRRVEPGSVAVAGPIKARCLQPTSPCHFFPSSSHCTNTPSALHFNVANTASPDKSAAAKTLLLPTTTIVKASPYPHRIASLTPTSIASLPTTYTPTLKDRQRKPTTTKMSSSALSSKDVNASVAATGPQDPKAAASADVKSMEYHRQVLQSKIDNQSEYASPLPPLPLSPSPPCFAPAADKTTNRQDKAVHLPLGQHPEPLHRQAQRLSEQAGWEVRSLSLPRSPLPRDCADNDRKQGQAQIAVCPRLA